MIQIFNELIANRVLVTAVISWLSAQIIKVILVCIISKKIDLGRMIGSGGMPSSHSSFVVSLAVGIGITYGFDNVLFAICTCFALVVMYDATGVRRNAGEQAKMINKLVDSWGRGEFKDTDKKLKELLGHTPLEVCAGALLGIIIALIRH